MCGIVGIYSTKPVATALYESLIHLQHRGQDAAGILTGHHRFEHKAGQGLVREIFAREDIETLVGNIGIAHTRYPTAGGNTAVDVQPVWLGSPRGIALAHNGNLVNYRELALDLMQNKHRYLHSSMDSEVLLHLLAEGLDKPWMSAQDDAVFFEGLCTLIQSIFGLVQGSCSVVSLILGKGLLAFRDPHGIRPLSMGSRTNETVEKDYIFASENTMFYALGFEHQGDVLPGEVVFVNQSGKIFRKILTQKPHAACVFEYVYFARPDAMLDTISINKARMRMGQNLAKRWQETYPDLLPDVVIPVPFTSNTAALAMARELQVLYSEGLYKNPFIGRTFIMSDGKKRAQQVRYKLTPQRMEIQDKKVLLVDDSIVRGTTSKEIVKMVRENGAKAVYLASACPPVKEACYYGIDIPSRAELIAAKKTEKEIEAWLQVDALLYQTQADLVEAITRKGEHKLQSPCMACLNGCYVSGNICEKKKMQLQHERHHTQEVV